MIIITNKLKKLKEKEVFGMTTNNRICSMQKYFVVAGLWIRPAEFVVSMRPKNIQAKEMNM